MNAEIVSEVMETPYLHGWSPEDFNPDLFHLTNNVHDLQTFEAQW